MIKKTLLFIIIVLTVVLPAGAVLKERDLAHTLSVLRAELKNDYERQQVLMARYYQQGITQHQQLVSYMTQCEQIGLMLYSQSQDNTFDMAYACRQATILYSQLNMDKRQTLPYNVIIQYTNVEIERYEALIASLKSMPPVDVSDTTAVISESDSIIMQAIDSLANVIDTMQNIPIGNSKNILEALIADEELEHQPLFLTGQQLKDREDCLRYAVTLHKNLVEFLEKLQAESIYYDSVKDKVEQLHEFAESRYRLLQENIFRNRHTDYFSLLLSLPKQIEFIKMTLHSKYAAFDGDDTTSDWRGVSVLFISIFFIFYLSIALGITYLVLRFCLPKKYRAPEYLYKRRMLSCVVGVGLFMLIITIIRYIYGGTHMMRMGLELIIDLTWLMQVIFISIYIRLKGETMQRATLIYTPLLIIAFVVVMFRITLSPNNLVQLLCPPILLLCTIWQLVVAAKYRHTLPSMDLLFANMTSTVMVIGTIASWIGYTLLAVQLLVWWNYQLAFIMTITCLYDFISLRRLKCLQQEWLFRLINNCLVPILAIISVLTSISWSAGIFEMTNICLRVFMTNFIDQEGLIQVSLYKLCIVFSMAFIFNYINYITRATYCHYRRQLTANHDNLNLTLARNIIAIVVWGLFFVISLAILRVPRDGISLVTAGLATGLGFAMKDLIENFFYGISLMAGRLRVGDYIECDGIFGRVESITYQNTQIATPDGCVVAFLNGALFSKNFKNLTRNYEYEKVAVPIGVAYGTDVHQVREMLIKAITPICQEKNANGKPFTDISKMPTVSLANFGDSSVDLAVVIWIRVEDKVVVLGRIRETIYNTLNANNIEIPFPQRDIHMR